VPIESPQLDDLRFNAVATQLRRQIALFNPEWTDHNESDPGITMLQLFAYLAEQIGFRLNRLPDKAYVEMLKLIGVRLAPAQPASTFLAFYLAKPETAVAFLIDEATRIKAKAKTSPPPTFETIAPVDAVPGQLAAMVTTQSDDLRDIALGTKPVTDLDTADTYVPARFSLTWDGRQPKLKDWPEKPVRAFGRPTETQQLNLWLGLAFNPLPSAGFVGQRVTLDFQLDDDEQPDAKDVADCALDLDALAEAIGPAIELVYYRPPQLAEVQGSWQPLRVISDGTAGLTRSGAIKLDIPLAIGPVPDAEWADVRAAVAKTTEQLCAEAAGTPKKIPLQIPHPLVGALKTPVSGTPAKVPVSGWIGIRFAQPPSSAIALRAVTFNAVKAIAATTIRNELVGSGNGRSGQIAQLANRNLLASTLELIAMDLADNQFHRWTQVSDFDTATPDDRCYVLDPEAGLIYFGDGKRGRVPALGARIVATRYRFTDATSTELPVATVTQGENLPGFVQDVTNAIPARGGRSAETLDEAKQRAPRELKTLGRAVTADDFELLAGQTPDARIAKSVVIPLRRPYSAEGLNRPGVDVTRVAPGALSVVAVPAGAGAFLAPTEGVLRAVCRHLNQYRLVTTELYVVAPQYVRVFDLVITVVARPGFTRTQLREAIAARLETYLHVLNGGPDGTGFGFGTTLHHAELVAQVFRVDGVDRVESITARHVGNAPDATPPMVWRDERQTARNLVACPSGDLDDDRIVLFPDETVLVDTTSLNVIVL
jgi:predicted phage baseplate assembly protein